MSSTMIWAIADIILVRAETSPLVVLHYTYLSSESKEGKAVDYESEIWADHDPGCHGDPQLPSIMEDPAFQDVYLMPCCEKGSNSLGCTISRHKPRCASSGVKRAKR
jgi:hypothetical protein